MALAWHKHPIARHFCYLKRFSVLTSDNAVENWHSRMSPILFRLFAVLNFNLLSHSFVGLVLEHSLLSDSIVSFPSVEDARDLKLSFLCYFYCETVKGKMINYVTYLRWEWSWYLVIITLLFRQLNLSCRDVTMQATPRVDISCMFNGKNGRKVTFNVSTEIQLKFHIGLVSSYNVLVTSKSMWNYWILNLPFLFYWITGFFFAVDVWNLETP